MPQAIVFGYLPGDIIIIQHGGDHRKFVIVGTHRVVRAHKVYTPFRASSVTVRTRHAASVSRYRVTRTKTTVTGSRGKSATKTTTTVKGPKGKVKAQKTRVRKN